MSEASNISQSLLIELASEAQEWAALLGDNFVGAYVTGSVSLGAFEPATSDLDAIVVVRSSLEREEAQRIAASALELGHRVPAAGLEVVVVTQANALTPRPSFEIAVSSGREWKDEVEYQEEDPSLLVDMAICHHHGITLIGPPAHTVFALAPDERLRGVFEGCMHWHRRWILDGFHDPGGQNSVLNACRAWCWAETAHFRSKIAGGEWAMQNGGPAELIQGAIALKRDPGRPALDGDEIDRFLSDLLTRLSAHIPNQ